MIIQVKLLHENLHFCLAIRNSTKNPTMSSKAAMIHATAPIAMRALFHTVSEPNMVKKRIQVFATVVNSNKLWMNYH